MELYNKLVANEESLALVGLGYVGMPIAVAFAKKGLKVIGFDLNKEKIVFFIWGEDNTINQFKKDSKTTDFKYIPIDPILAVRMAHGTFPLYLFVSDGEVVNVAGLRQLSEKDVIQHLQ